MGYGKKIVRAVRNTRAVGRSRIMKLVRRKTMRGSVATKAKRKVVFVKIRQARRRRGRRGRKRRRSGRRGKGRRRGRARRGRSRRGKSRRGRSRRGRRRGGRGRSRSRNLSRHNSNEDMSRRRSILRATAQTTRKEKRFQALEAYRNIAPLTSPKCQVHPGEHILSQQNQNQPTKKM